MTTTNTVGAPSAASMPKPAPMSDQAQKDLVTSLYRELLGREPDAGGLEFHVNCLKNGTTPEQLRQGLINSDEYKAKHAGQAPAAPAVQSNATQNIADAAAAPDDPLPWEADQAPPGTVHNTFNGIPQYFENSCAAVEAMAAWKERDPEGFQQAVDDLYNKAGFTLPNGEEYTAFQELMGVSRTAVGPDASPEDLKMAMMQCALMEKADFSWHIGGGQESVNAEGFQKLNDMLQTGAYIPSGDPAGDQAQFDALAAQYGQVQVVMQSGDGGHAMTVQRQEDGTYTLEQGNAPILGEDGQPLTYTWAELSSAMATGSLLDDIGARRGGQSGGGGNGEV